MPANNKETSSKSISYDTIAKHFSEEAISLIPDNMIKQTLGEEKIRFENAEILCISPLSIVGNNTLRHCKDLLRKKQPLSFLYTLLCFLSEVSIMMLIYGLFLSIGTAFFAESGFFSSFSFLYELILFSGVISGITIFRKHLHTVLAIPFSSAKPSDSEIAERKKTLKRRRILSLFLIFAIMAIATGIVASSNLYQIYTINITVCFFAYIICMVLMGIHNVIFNSHIIPFLAVGRRRLLMKAAKNVEEACKTYLELSYLQILTQANKTTEDCKRNPALSDKLQQSVYSRTVTTRVYCALALVILVILDVACIFQLREFITIAFLVFFTVSLLLTVIFLIAILSTNYILKQTKNKQS